MKKTKQDAEYTKRCLLDAAQTVFLSYGYSATTLERIAVEAGLTRGAVYHHFKGGKGQVLSELCEERFRRLEPVLGSTFDSIEEMIMSYFRLLITDKKFAELQYILTFKIELSDELMGGLQQKVDANKQCILSYTDALRKSTRLSKKKAHSLAVTILSMQIGLTNLWLVDKSAIDLEKQATELVGFIHRYIELES